VHIPALVLFWLLSSEIELIFDFFDFFDAVEVQEWVVAVTEVRVMASEPTGHVGGIKNPRMSPAPLSLLLIIPSQTTMIPHYQASLLSNRT
jgi:hypothetical protein